MAYRSKHTGRFVKGHRRHNEPGHRRHRRRGNRGRHRYSSYAHNPYLAAFNPRHGKRARRHRVGGLMRRFALGHYFSQNGLMEAATVGGSGLVGATTTYLGERVLVSYFTFLTPYAVAADWTSILVRALARLGVATLGTWGLGGFFKGANRTGFVAGTLTYATGATLLEALGYNLQVGQGPTPVSSVLSTIGLSGYLPRPGGASFPRTNGMNLYVPDIYPSRVAAYVPRPGVGDMSVMDRIGLGEMYSHPFRAYGY